MVADALSRVHINSFRLKLTIDLKHIAAEQEKCGLRKCESEAYLIESSIDAAGTTLLCDLLTEKTHPRVPASLRRQVFDSMHSLYHPGVRVFIKLIAE